MVEVLFPIDDWVLVFLCINSLQRVSWDKLFSIFLNNGETRQIKMLGHFQEKKSENFLKLFYCHWIRGMVTPSSYICWYRNSDKKLSIYFGPRSTFSRASLSLFERFENLPKAFSRRNRFGNDRLSRDAKGLCLGWIPGIFGIWSKNSKPNSQGIGWNFLYPRIQRDLMSRFQ